VAVGRGEDGGERLLGTASLFAYHGMPEEPHYYLRVVENTVHSKQLGTGRTRHLLKLGRDIEPWTELGGLVVHPAARGQGVGKLLVAARLPCWWRCTRGASARGCSPSCFLRAARTAATPSGTRSARRSPG